MKFDVDQFIERAAIREYCGEQSRFAAETAAAREQGIERWQALQIIREQSNANGSRSAGSSRAGGRAMARQRGAQPVPRVQPEPKEENRSVPVDHPHSRGHRDSLPSLRAQRGGTI